jgi:hypothetical protein
MDAIGTLTRLRRLELVDIPLPMNETLQCSRLTALKRLTHLNLSDTYLAPLPPNLGQALPHLEVLLVRNCRLRDLPRGMTRLTRLEAPHHDFLHGSPMAGLSEATALRLLNLSRCGLSNLSPLSVLNGLETLLLRGHIERPSQVPGGGGEVEPEDSEDSWDEVQQGEQGSTQHAAPSAVPSLPRLLTLRHLDLSDSNWHVSELVAISSMQHLTHLDLSYGLRLAMGHDGSDVGSLPVLGVLPALLQLNLRGVQVDGCQWPAVGAWLGRQSQLTRLSLRSTLWQLAGSNAQQQAEGLEQLPTQLVELDLVGSGLQQWPQRLSQMTGLRVLLVGEGNPHLTPQLPPWLLALQQLEVLNARISDVRAVQEEAMGLLMQLPRLGRLSVAHSNSSCVDMQRIMSFVGKLRVQLPHVLHYTDWWSHGAHANDLFRVSDDAYEESDDWD